MQVARKYNLFAFLSEVVNAIENDFMINLKPFIWNFRGKIHYTDVFNMLRQIDPPLGFGKKCPERMAYKKLIRMNMPMDKEGKVSNNDFLKYV